METVSLIPSESIVPSIFMVRNQKVMLDRDLAVLYGVPTKVINQAVKRNRPRFPKDFMFRLSKEEANFWWHHISSGRLRSQIVTLKRGCHIKYLPYAFTEHGILMLSSVLNSERAVQVNIIIMRAFIRLRQILASHANLAKRLDVLENRYDKQFKKVFDSIHQIMFPSKRKPKPIGFIKHRG